MRCLVTIRGDLREPILYVINLRSGKVEKKLTYQIGLDTNFPADKMGFAGLVQTKHDIYIAAWDRIAIVDAKTLKLKEVISNRLFTDLHGIDYRNEKLYLASTNIDSIIEFDLQTKKARKVFSVWQENKFIVERFNQKGDYNRLTKKESIFHSEHINSIFFSGLYCFISSLGKFYRPLTILGKIKKKLGFGFYKKGGIYILDKKYRIMRMVVSEGLHDPFIENHNIIFTEYFTNSLLFLDSITLKMRRLKLKIPKNLKHVLLTRGGVYFDNQYIIGHSIHRSASTEFRNGMIRYYDRKGNYLDKSIELPESTGIYGIYQWENYIEN